MFKKNEGILDRSVRVTLGIVLLPTGLFLFGGLQGNVRGLVAAGFGTWGLITGLVGVCPLYTPFGINTLEKEKKFIAQCKSRMDVYRQEATGNGHPGAERNCGPCGPSIGKTYPQQEEDVPE